MKQVTIISGKGGTGKTSLTAAFASLAKNTVFADCDVDAADLHLILTPEIQETHSFIGLPIARINDETCTGCGSCYEHCRFGAISKDHDHDQDQNQNQDEDFAIDPFKCEGCGVCAYVCPVDAITMEDRASGFAYESVTRFGPLVHAKLKIAEEASGKLVALVRNLARIHANQNGHELILIDGPPGIGCPVIAAITGVDLVVIVTEPTLSGIHDLERVLGVAEHFTIPTALIINKYDINEDITEAVTNYCTTHNVPVIGKLPYDVIMTEAMIHGKTLLEFSDGEVAQAIKHIWVRLRKMLAGE